MMNKTLLVTSVIAAVTFGFASSAAHAEGNTGLTLTLEALLLSRTAPSGTDFTGPDVVGATPFRGV